MDEGSFFRVVRDDTHAPLSDHLLHGYESRQDFRAAVRLLVDRWKGRVGECVGGRHGFLLLRFHDTPGGKPDEEWLPRYLLEPAETPEYMSEQKTADETETLLDQAFGFD